MITLDSTCQQDDEDAFKVLLYARNSFCLERRDGSSLLNVGTKLNPLRIPATEAWQQSYAMLTLSHCTGSHRRLQDARRACVRHEAEEQPAANRLAWSRAVDLCDQALRMVEGIGAVHDDRARHILLAVCKYESAKAGMFFDPQDDTREIHRSPASRERVDGRHTCTRGSGFLGFSLVVVAGTAATRLSAAVSWHLGTSSCVGSHFGSQSRFGQAMNLSAQIPENELGHTRGLVAALPLHHRVDDHLGTTGNGFSGSERGPGPHLRSARHRTGKPHPV